MNQYTKLKWYQQTWLIAILFALWFLMIPPIVGIILLVSQSKYIKTASALMEAYGGVDAINKEKAELEASILHSKRNAEADIKGYADHLRNDTLTLENKANALRIAIKEMEDEKTSLLAELPVMHYDFSAYDSLTSQKCKDELALLKTKTKELIASNKAVIGDTSSKSGKSNAKQIIRLFNAECDNVILNLTSGRVDSARSKIVKSFDTINKIFTVDGLSLSNIFLENKLEELNLVYSHLIKAEQEKEIQKAIKEQMLEEEKARREIEAAKKKIEKDEKQFNGEIKKLLAYMQKTDNEAEKQLYLDKIKELEDKLHELEIVKKDVDLREANATAGYVYVISNIGSFGEDVYKIGMTRRLEPMDRVKELSSASVPFEFDVHAMIFSDNAPELENTLHERFRNNSVNKVNYRKEFFNVSLSEIENIVKCEFNNTAEFTLIPQATEYRETMRINSENK